MSLFFKRAGACLLSLLCLLAGGCFYQGYSSYQTLGLSDKTGRAAGLEPETDPEPACPEGYWMYDGRLFEQQARRRARAGSLIYWCATAAKFMATTCFQGLCEKNPLHSFFSVLQSIYMPLRFVRGGRPV